MAMEAGRPWDAESDGSDEGATVKRPWDESAGDRWAWNWPDEESSDLGEDDIDEDAALTKPSAAAQAFFDLFIDLYMTSTISAMTFCIGCFYLGVMGQMLFKVYGRRPGHQTGSYQRFLDGKFSFKQDSKKNYIVECAGHAKRDISRGVLKIPMRCVHEVLDDEVAGDPTIVVSLREMIENHELPPSYYDHPVVLENPDFDVLPLQIFIDGLPYSLVDSVCGIWLINMVSKVHHCIGLVRKRICCKCGCAGWDTFFPIFCAVRWMMIACRLGVNPLLRHDDTRFNASDVWRASRAGAALRMKACLLHMKLDWSEICSRMGFPTWTSNMRPCVCCNGIPPGMYDSRLVTENALPWYVNTDDDYEAAAARCEIHVSLDPDQHRLVCGSLKYDKRPQGNRGICLVRAMPPQLQAGDRLEPTPSMQNVADFFTMTTFPVLAVFWRCSLQDVVLRRFPLWDRELGITPNRVMAFDVLHTYLLGPVLNFCRWLIWQFLQSGSFCGAETTAPERIHVALLRVRAMMMAWQDKYQRMNAVKLTTPQEITPKMVGTANDQKLKLKAMESYSVLLFLRDLLRSEGHHIEGYEVPRMIKAADCLVRYYDLTRNSWHDGIWNADIRRDFWLKIVQ